MKRLFVVLTGPKKWGLTISCGGRGTLGSTRASQKAEERR